MNAVRKMYQEVVSQVKVEGEDSKEFAVRVGIHQGSILSLLIFAVMMNVVTEEVAKEGRALMYADDLVLICETKEEARQRFVAWRNALESKGLKVRQKRQQWIHAVCVWKEGGCELNPLCNLWLLGARAMFRSARKFGESGTGFCVKSM